MALMWKPVYASLAEMRDWLRLRDPTDIEDDALLQVKLSAASRAVDASCGRQFGQENAPVARSYEVRWSRTLCAYVAEIDDLMDTTGMAWSCGGNPIDPASVKLRPRNALADGMPYTYALITSGIVTGKDLDVVAKWGWNQVPDVVKEATLLQASRLNIRRDSPYGIAGSPDTGGEVRLLERLDPDITPLVRDYVRRWVVR